MKRSFALLCLLAFCQLAIATGSATPKPLLLTAEGSIEVDAEGKVAAHHVEETLAPALRDWVSRAVQAWRFEPILIDGRAVSGKTRMRIDLEALPLPEQRYQLRIKQVQFSIGSSTLESRRGHPPSYPMSALRAGVGAQVRLAARFGADGAVIDIVPVQISLEAGLSERSAARYRKEFAEDSFEAAKHWRYPPVDQIDGRMAETTVLLVVHFSSGRSGADVEVITPGPVSPVPWLELEPERLKPEALMAIDYDQVLNTRFRLVEPVAGRDL